MQDNHSALGARFPFFLHGGDYNPDQWRHVPGAIDEDFRLLPLAGVNSVSVAIFSWAALEPDEGRYEFGWLDDVMDRAAAAGMAVVLATPSGAKPAWLAAKYPEVRRMNAPAANLPPQRELQSGRHNHCPTSPVYRARVSAINEALASRYGRHPALALWHLSNEYNGECHCPLCLAAFRDWLRAKYGSLDALNQAWWTGFWAHTYSDWSQIECIDHSVDGLVLDWRRFVTDQTADFIRAEAEPLRRLSPGVPVTANLMGFFDGLDYARLARELDVVSWDSYPQFHQRPGETERTAALAAMTHDYMRSLKPGRPFLMMESSPGPVNWWHHNRLLRPGQHRLKSLQAVARGSDSVQYFQLRAGRGGSEKFHAAVIGQQGHGRTRMFSEVAQVGHDLGAIRPALGSAVRPRVAIVFDRESTWSLAAAQGPLDSVKRDPVGTALAHYLPYWRRGIAVDVVDEGADLASYALVVAPALFLLRDGFAERVGRFVESGGTFLATWLTGVVGPTGLCHTGGAPGPLAKVLGLHVEEIDWLYEDEANSVVAEAGNPLGISGTFPTATVCEVVSPDGAAVAARFGRDFYAGRPALTVNRLGKGEAWYLATRGDDALLDAIHGALAGRLALPRALPGTGPLPEGVEAAAREGAGGDRFTFVLNHAGEPRTVDLGPRPFANMLDDGAAISGQVELPAFGVLALRQGKDGEAVPPRLPDIGALAPRGPKTMLWPDGKMPDFQPHQIAATTEEAAEPGFDPDASRAPHIQWYPAPDPSVATDACAIIISGGGYDCCCDLPAYQPLVAELLRAGVHCVNFTYRTPRPKGIPLYKTAWEDGRRAVRLVRAQAAERGIDPAKIGAMSCSAGSHLALLLALSSRSPAPCPPVDALDDTPATLAWLLAMCPAYVLEDGLGWRNANGGEDSGVDSIFAVDGDSCPVCFFHGGADPYSPLGSTRLWRLLRGRGITSELHLDATRGHGPIGPAPFRLHALGFLRRLGVLPALPGDEITPPGPTDAEALAAVEAWEAARRIGAPRDLHIPLR